MKKSILKLGKVLTRTEKSKVKGGKLIYRCTVDGIGDTVYYDTSFYGWVVVQSDGETNRISPSVADQMCSLPSIEN